jgi:uncharacterized protein (TIGR01319 family)
MIVACIDIGSTWTKGAAFRVTGREVQVVARAAQPTRVDDLSAAFFATLDEIAGGDALTLRREGLLELQYSSSAKGGLAVAAIGLVPEMTVEVGRIAAQSAGAKLTRSFAFHLTRQDIATLEATPPDIVLFAGGTDGGNTDYVLANAEAIGRSAIDCDFVYAGNRSVADAVAERLAGKRLRIVDNLMPVFNEPNPDPARDAIRTIFLETIVSGKGLDRIVAATGAAPVPTPYTVLEYTRAIREHVAGWDSFVVLDMGGATTDVYSAHQASPEAGTVLRGLPEPAVKRTVEGDLGMRVSAATTVDAAEDDARRAALAAAGVDIDALRRYARRLVAQPDHLPQQADEQRLDAALAAICVGDACLRHVGRLAPIYTPDGKVNVQTGRDLRKVSRVIGSGGWLSRAASFDPTTCFTHHAVDKRGRVVLLPQRFSYYRDEAYLFPLLANLARSCPEAAASAGIAMLTS